MKKYFILAAAALSFAACSSDDEIITKQEAGAEQGQVPVLFDSYVNRGLTRAGDPGELVLSSAATKQIDLETKGFGVFGYYTDNVTYSQSSIPNFMYNTQVSTSSWTYSPVKYWPNEYGTNAISDGVDRLTFFAYAPWVPVTPGTGRVTGDQTTGIVGMTSNVATGDPYIKYFVDMDPGKSVDLCWGVSDAAFSSTVSGPTANDIASGGAFIDLVKPLTDAKIKFNFKHALAKLNVQIDADVDEVVPATSHNALATGTKIYVRSVTFEGFALKGLLNLNASASEGPLWYDLSSTNTKIGSATSIIYDGRRDGKEGQANGDASNEKPSSLNASIIQKNTATDGVTNTPVNLFNSTFASPDKTDPVYVIPTDGPLTITIVYDVETSDSNVAGYLSDGTTHGSTIENKITKEIIAGGLKAGFAYTVNLHLGMNSVKFDAAVAGWESGSSVNTPLPDNK